MSRQLATGANTIVVQATNATGTTSKSTVINYNPVINPNPKPVINIIDPTANPYITSDAQRAIRGKVLNVSSGNNIVVKRNGVVIPGLIFNPSSRLFRVNMPLVSGTNSIQFIATNSSGTTTKTITIQNNSRGGSSGRITPNNSSGGKGSTSGKVTPVGKGKVTPPKMILLQNPKADTTTTTNANYNFSGRIVQVTRKSDIRVTVNGKVQPFTWVNKTLAFNAKVPLKAGYNTIVISAGVGKLKQTKRYTIFRKVAATRRNTSTRKTN